MFLLLKHSTPKCFKCSNSNFDYFYAEVFLVSFYLFSLSYLFFYFYFALLEDLIWKLETNVFVELPFKDYSRQAATGGVL